ncbi:SDR family NAD(P)-dependent oxidoreductase [Alkalimonas collagenimarina]|uniref:SDR family NAD(P)-dependent oxidoreductase n=1 Tax=Alkalimonas collagenimarina TaxID=400390 RepID=A0ABT9H0Y6_9GAMM|nr:SDR family NAD(P)-dependent oxidoreductase [Alkalimonas collagenimarina]MDP4536966.1 SDR family NAD(P)-dependent oxidoreductase [Alkalimonas collagenimarina]
MSTISHKDIAIIGMACRFPKAENYHQYWENLLAQKSCISDIPHTRWDWRHYDGDPLVEVNKSNSRWGGFIDKVNCFDYRFFGISPSTAQAMDPQQRIMLELSWACMEDAGVVPQSLAGQNVGVYIGAFNFDYKELLEKHDRPIEAYQSTGTANAIIANRISHFYDFNGPSVTVDTACSASMNAVHSAMQSLQLGETDLALAGGINLILTPTRHISFSKTGMLSPSGQSKSFDAGADGYVRSEGAGLILLKPLAAALADNDQIHGVIKGGAVNHCGKTHTLTYPSYQAQAQVISRAMHNAQVTPDTMTYIEAHGTGTPKGDPIEIQGLQHAFQHSTDTQYCAIGSAKSNIGHLEAAAGIAGIIKVLLSMRAGVLPGLANFKSLNPRITLDDSPFYVLQNTQPWQQRTDSQGYLLPRRAGVSAFGFGGTNGHIVLEEAPARAQPSPQEAAQSPHIFVFSAKAEASLQAQLTNMHAWLSRQTTLALAQLSANLYRHRTHFSKRVVVIASSQAALLENLQDAIAAVAEQAYGKPFHRERQREAPVYDQAAQWLQGMDIDHHQVIPELTQHISLPSYAFEPSPCWFELLPEADNQALYAPTEATPELAVHRVVQGENMAAGVGKCALVPRWVPLEPQLQNDVASSQTGTVCHEGVVCVVGANVSQQTTLSALHDRVYFFDAQQSPDKALAEIASQHISHVIWIPPMAGDDVPGGAQNRAVQVCFQWLQFVLHGLSVAPSCVTLLMQQDKDLPEDIAFEHAPLVGMLGSISKEYPALNVRLFDVGNDTEWPLQIIGDIQRRVDGVHLYRNGQWLVRQFVPIKWANTLSTTAQESVLCRPGGVYVLVGGAGGIGRAVTAYMLKQQNVHIVWLGRRALDPQIQSSIEQLRKEGGTLQYVQADVTEYGALQTAYHTILKQFGRVNGVINAAMVFKACAFKNMSFDDFSAVYDAKVQSSVNLARLLKYESLDYLVNFSSINSFITAAEQSHYAAGSMFQDTLSNALQRVVPFQVKTINWGYWTAEGALADSDMFQYWRAKSGVGDLTITDAMAVLETVMRSELHQVAYINALTASANLPNTDLKQRCYVDAVARRDALELSDLNRFLLPAGPELGGGLTFRAADELTIQYMWYQLYRCGLFDGSDLTLQALQQRLQQLRAEQTVSYLQLWLHKAINLLCERGMLAYQTSEQGAQCGLSITEQGRQLATDERILTQWAEACANWTADPATAAQARLLDATLSALPAVLSAEKRATEVMFPESSMRLLEGIYKHNPVSDYFNRLVADVVSHIIRHGFMHGKKTRILEIGAGTGGTSALIFETLQGVQHQVEEYCYTDISRAFLMHAHTHYQAHNPFLKTAIFNVEQPVDEQAVERGSYDMVIATNVLHATRNIRNTLRNAKALLKAGGVLILNELSEDSIFCHMTFGLLEGWWLHEDSAIRIPECPGLTSLGWKQALEQEGYHDVAFPQLSAHPLGQQIIVAKSNGVQFAQTQPSADTQPPPAAANIDTDGASIKDETETNVQPVATQAHSVSELKNTIKQVIADALKYSVNDIQVDESFADYGVDSITGVNVVQALNEALSLTLHSTCLFDYTNITRLVDHIASQLPEKHIAQNESTDDEGAAQNQPELQSRAPASMPAASSDDDIAIVGMSGRFGKADNVSALWAALERGEDLVEPVRRWNLAQYYPDTDPSEYCDTGALLTRIDQFDPGFFNLSPKEATYMDPQQRLFMETCWHALEDAGLSEQSLDGEAVSIYVGCEQGDYDHLFDDAPLAQAFWGNAPSIIPARISYHLNLKGPAIAIDTACSSSLVAIHHACESLRHVDVDIAIAGGVFVQSTPDFYLKSNRANMLSKSGKCYTFDERADGFVPGEGVGVVVLKRLRDAIANKDRIYGVIKASGINQDGTSNGITAPSSMSQESLIRDTYDNFNINPENIQLVEAHGTGTRLGDPIEYEALSRAYRHYSKHTAWSALGSIKTNLGHAATAAGMAGLCKILLSLQHKKIPASLHYNTGNPAIQFDGSPFYVNTELSDWQSHGQRPRAAAISSFGFSGTNAHLVIEEAPELPPTEATQTHYLLCLSAKTAQQLSRRVEDLLVHVQRGLVSSCADLSYSLLLRRSHFEYRFACVVESLAQAEQTLKQWIAREPGAQVYDNIQSVTASAARPGYAQFAMDSLNKAITAQNHELYQQALAMLGQLYSEGEACDFSVLFQHSAARVITLPDYPFERKTIWIDNPGETKSSAAVQQRANTLHPLVHHNASTFLQQRFVSHFDGQDYFSQQHVIHGKKILPGVSMVEMVRAALSMSTHGTKPVEQQTLVMNNIGWLTPFILDEPAKTVHIDLSRDETCTRFEVNSVTSSAQAEPLTHCSGEVQLETSSAPSSRAEPERPESGSLVLSAESVYAYFEQCQIAYGVQFRRVSQLTLSGTHGVADIVAHPEQSVTQKEMMIEPGMFDGVLQSAAVLIARSCHIHEALVPIALEQLWIYGAFNGTVRAHINLHSDLSAHAGVHKVNIEVFSEDGKLIASMTGLSFRAMVPTSPSPDKVPVSAAQDGQTLQFSRAIQPTARTVSFAPSDRVTLDKAQLIVVLDEGQVQIQVGADSASCQAQLQQVCGQFNGAIHQDFDKTLAQYSTCLLAILQLLIQQKHLTEIRLQVVAVAPMAEDDANILTSVTSSLSALLKTIALEDPRFHCQFIDLAARQGTAPPSQAHISGLCHVAAKHQGEAYLLYKNNTLYRETWTEMDPVATPLSPWRDDAVYLITGGLGGIGYAIAQDIVQHARTARIFLLGSRQADRQTEQQIAQLNGLGGHASYHSVDVTQVGALNTFIAAHKNALKRITILHCAGVTRDSLVAYMAPAHLHQTYQPKTAGVVNLDIATEHLDVEHLVLFSSVSAVLGNVGQGNYATANKFMDWYATYRNQLSQRGERRGRTVSINWPIWGTEGMAIDAPTLARMHQDWGMSTMAPQEGLQTLYQVLQGRHDNVFVMHGVSARIRALFNAPSEPQSSDQTMDFLIAQSCELTGVAAHELDTHLAFDEYGFDMTQRSALIDRLSAKLGESIDKAILYSARSLDELNAYLNHPTDHPQQSPELSNSSAQVSSEQHTPVATQQFTDNVAQLLRELVQQHTDIALEDITSEAHFERYGIDSLMVVSMTSALEKICGRLPKTLFFEYNSIAQISQYISEHYPDKLQAHFAPTTDVDARTAATEGESIDGELTQHCAASQKEAQQAENTALPAQPEHIAIVGIAGRYPKASSLHEFWQNLVQGVDAITEIPASRWDHSRYFDERKGVLGKTYSKWGGFIDGVDEFDPLFFNISPHDAEFMDPQERIFLQCAYHALEDAGYADTYCAQPGANPLGEQVGVFVGVMYSEYQLYGAQQGVHGTPISLGASAASIANRVSFSLNFTGPSLAVDSMCSASLTSIHLACESILNGHCDAAIAGGVNLNLHPNKYLNLAQGNFASSEGRCKSFAADGNGYVPSEGCGALILKPLSQALRDNDHIYGLIKASSINHAGKTNGYTVPSPNAQAEVISRALSSAGVDVTTLGYIEAHGTGTSLGDPIEISGLEKAFNGMSSAPFSCRIGSVKSNIGHCEGAAGVAGVSKVLLQMKHQKLVPSIHAQTLNPNIDFEHSLLQLQTDYEDWPHQQLGGTMLPYRAGISSFGAGGANAHIVLEEYPAPARSAADDRDVVLPYMFSAVTPQQLSTLVSDFLAWFAAGHFDLVTLADIAYTLQVGRKALKERLVIIASSRTELVEKLKSYQGGQAVTGVFSANIKAAREAPDQVVSGFIAYPWLLDWCLGHSVDPQALWFAHQQVRRVSLPTYPFKQDSYWYTSICDDAPQLAPVTPHQHPLLQRNTSNFAGVCYENDFNGQEWFLRDHQVSGEKVLPGLAYLEMAVQAAKDVSQLSDSNRLSLSNIIWRRAVVVGEQGGRVDMTLTPKDSNNDIEFMVQHNGALCMSAQLNIHQPGSQDDRSGGNKQPDLQQLKDSARAMAPAGFYAEFARHGITYGETHRLVQALYVTPTQVLASIALAQTQQDQLRTFTLHPGLMDAALQSIKAFYIQDADPRLMVPFSCQQVLIHAALSPTMWVLCRRDNKGAKHQFDIEVFNNTGELSVQFKQLAVMPYHGPGSVHHAPSDEQDNMTKISASQSATSRVASQHEAWDQYLIPRWTTVAVAAEHESRDTQRNTLVVELGDYSKALSVLQYNKGTSIALKESYSVEDIVNKITHAGEFDEIVCLAANVELDYERASGHDLDLAYTKLSSMQKGSALLCFNFIKALLQSGYANRALDIKLVTIHAFSVLPGEGADPAYASLHGLFGCLAKEYKNWQVTAVDSDFISGLPIHALSRIEQATDGVSIAYRQGQWFIQQLYSYTPPSVSDEPYRDGGVYVVVGGAGGLGQVWSEMMIKTHQSHVIWIGRREQDSAISDAIERLAQYGPKPWYLCADASDPVAMRDALDAIKLRHSHIHGVVHSALVLQDRSLARMSQDEFLGCLSAKVDISLCLAQTFKAESLDFALFFSSLIAFTRNPGQANYATGSVFEDVFATQINRHWSCKVSVINWGYWGDVGAVSDASYRQRMEQAGILSIQPAPAMAAIHHLLSSDEPQLGFIRVDSGAQVGGVNEHAQITRAQALPDVLPDIQAEFNLAYQAGTARQQALSHLEQLDQQASQALADALLPLLAVQLRAAGIFAMNHGSEVSMSDLVGSIQRLGLNAFHSTMFSQWLTYSVELLQQAGWIKQAGQQLLSLQPVQALNADTCWQRWKQYCQHNQDNNLIAAKATLLDAMVTAIPGIITGKLKATDIMFPQSSMALVEGVYKNNEVSDYFNHDVALTVCAAIRAWQQQGHGRTLRILEIGAGTGGTTAGLLEKLRPFAPQIAEYCYTDVSQAFLNHAQTHYVADFPFIKTQLLNIEQPLLAQGVNTGSYDIVIAAQVLHATKSISTTLVHTKALLKRNGVLILNELSERSVYSHLTFGLLDGWWLYQDAALRMPYSPGLSSSGWQHCLAAQGFSQSYFPAPQSHGMGQQIVIAISDGNYILPRQAGSTELPLGVGKPTEQAAQTVPAASASSGQTAHALTQVNSVIMQAFSAALKVPTESIDPTEAFSDYGLDSITGVNVAQTISTELGVDLNTTALFDYVNVEQLAQYVVSLLSDQAENDIPHVKPTMSRAAPGHSWQVDHAEVMAVITRALSYALKVPPEVIEPTEAFSDYGLDSITGVSVAQTISNDLNIDLNTTVLFDHVNVEQLCQHILAQNPDITEATVSTSAPPEWAAAQSSQSKVADDAQQAAIYAVITQALCDALKVPAADIDPHEGFADYGLDSISGVGVAQQISQQLGIELSTTVLFDYVSVHQLADHILTSYPRLGIAVKASSADDAQAVQTASDNDLMPSANDVQQTPKHDVQDAPAWREYPDEAIAVVGMSGRFPGSESVDALWHNIANRVDLVTPLTRWDMSKYAGLSADFCAQGGFLSHIDQFDPGFFNISGTEATYMDPQQRLFLQESWKALEDAGYAGDPNFGEKAGVYVGCNSGDYKNILSQEAPAQAFWGNASSITPARLSYYLNLMGPAVAVDTACSSSLVAIHLACQGLWSGELDVALAGGVFVQSTPEFYLQADRANMLSKRGRCQTFDAAADGFVPAEGVGVLILKRLADALADGDHIHGVIKGSGTNQDGASNGITAPSAKSQQKLIKEVHRRFNIAPEDIQLIEAHGTGTSLGDPIESEGLKASFQSDSAQPANACALGSIKSNMGHAITAAGVASAIKVLMALKHRQLPPTIHYEKLNAKINFGDTSFYVNTELMPWAQPVSKPRTAAISSFGFSGTNAHLVLEEAPITGHVQPQRAQYLFILSSQSQPQLVTMAKQLLAHSQSHELDLAATSFTLLNGRKHCAHRLAWVARDQQELAQILTAYIEGTEHPAYSYAQFDRKAFKKQLSLQAYSNECVQRFTSSQSAQEQYDALRIIADLFVQGYRIELSRLFLDTERRRVPLPTYPFEQKKYWAPASEGGDDTGAEPAPVSNAQPFSWLLTQPHYIPVPFDAVASWDKAVAKLAGKTLYLLGNEPQTAALAKLLNQVCDKAGLVDVPALTCLSYQQAAVMDSLASLPDHILCIDTLDDSARQAQTGLQGLFGLLKTTMKSNWHQAVEVYYIYEDRSASQAYLDAMSGFYESVNRENEGYRFTLIQHRSQQQTLQQMLLQEVLQSDGVNKAVKKVQYQQGMRHVEQHVEYHQDEAFGASMNGAEPVAFEAGKTYLITGGFGPVGRLLCERLVKTWQANFVVLSRSVLDDEQRALCEQLNQYKGRIHYYAVDICDQLALQHTLDQVTQQLGAIHGVVHMARLVHDNLLVAKSWQEFSDTIQAKVTGTVNLDQCLAEAPLDFFVMFSSIAAFGLRGGTDYGYSAAFQNSFARYRNGLTAQGRRSGRAISQCWAGWSVDRYMPAARMDVMQKHGMVPIDMDAAMPMFCESLNLSEPVVGFVGISDKDKAKHFFGVDMQDTVTPQSKQLEQLLSEWSTQPSYLSDGDKGAMKDAMVGMLAQFDVNHFSDAQVAKVHGILFGQSQASTEDAVRKVAAESATEQPQGEQRDIQKIVLDTVKHALLVEEISVDESLQYYGMDSVSAMQISSRLSKNLGMQIEPVWLLENPTVRAFADHLNAQFADSI